MAKINFFEEEDGVQSMMRLILFITVLNAIILTDTTVMFGLVTEGTGNIGSLVGSAVALFTGLTSFIATLKLLQKSKEVKENEGSNRELGEIPAKRAGGVTDTVTGSGTEESTNQ